MSNMTSAPDVKLIRTVSSFHRRTGCTAAELRRWPATAANRIARLARSDAGAKGREERFVHDEPLLLLLLQRLPARPPERVVLATPPARRIAPAGGDVALGFQAMQD